MNSRIARKALLGGAAVLSMMITVLSSAQAQDSDAGVNEYKAVLNSIANAKLSLLQKQAVIQNQDSQISSLNSQINGIEDSKKSIDPLLKKMADSIKTEVESDLPFLVAERFDRLANLDDIMNDATASPGDKYRRALNVYDAEINYGNSVTAYRGDNPITPGTRYAACLENQASKACNLPADVKKMFGGEDDATGLTVSKMACIKEKSVDLCDVSDGAKVWFEEKGTPDLNVIKDLLQDGHFVHYGRLALVYLQHDSSAAYRFDKETSAWLELSGTDTLNVRRGVRAARGETAPIVAKIPVAVIK